jgi:hypothetical protein
MNQANNAREAYFSKKFYFVYIGIVIEKKQKL